MPTAVQPAVGNIQFLLILQLSHNFSHFLRHRQANPGCVLEDGNSLIGTVEENNCCPQYTATTDHIDIQYIGHANQSHDADLLADSLEAHGA